METTCNIHILEDDCRYVEIDNIEIRHRTLKSLFIIAEVKLTYYGKYTKIV